MKAKDAELIEAAERQEDLKKKLLGSQEMVEKAFSIVFGSLKQGIGARAGPGAVEGAGTKLEGEG